MTAADGGVSPRVRTAAVIAHRGASRDYPANSLAAFARAIDLGADMVELDVRRTRDDVLVVQHDARHRGLPISRWTHAQLCSRPRRDGKRRGRLVGGAPPALGEVVSLCSGRIALDIELKGEGDEADMFAIALAQLTADALVVTSFIDAVVTRCKQLHPEIRAGLLVASGRHGDGNRLTGVALLDRATACGADFIAPNHLLATERFLQRAAQGGLPVVPWTVNRPKRLLRFLCDARVEAVVTDVPNVALELRRNAS